MMKIYLKIGLMVAAVILSSCENWLDLNPVGESTEDQIYKEGDGYRSVLNGLYQNMGKSSLYGMNLSFGLLDCLSQQYDMSKNNNSQEKFREMGAMNYKHSQVASYIDEIWLAAYNVIANANNLIQNIQQKSTPELFEQGAMERNMILGEAYACRALMHFDLLRLFAPAPVNDDHQNYIPYVEKYPNIQPQGITVDACLEKIIDDLNKAKELCMEFDTTALGMNAACTGDARFHNDFPYFTDLGDNPKILDSFFKGRGYRLNYYSIMALLARVYQYADRHKEAFECAEEVLKFTYKASQWDVFVFYEYNTDGIFAGSDNSTSAFEAKTDLRQVNNLIFGVYNEKAYDNLGLNIFFAKELVMYPQYFVVKQDMIFKSEDNVNEKRSDFRSTKLIYMGDDSYPISGKWFWHNNEDKRKKNVTIIPVIRATEMQYIMAEYFAREQNWAEAARILSDVRYERNCVSAVSFSTWPDFVKYLVNDARREWISEGQLFYLYKRLGTEVDFGNGVKRPYSRSEALLPIPASQSI